MPNLNIHSYYKSLDKAVYTDQIGNHIELPRLPLRIISLVPSQTELLYSLGLENELVGITRFCIHPSDKVGKVAKVGGTKKLDFEKIDALKPDLILANKEENYKEGIERLSRKYPVWTSDIYNLNNALAMIIAVGTLTGKAKISADLCDSIKHKWENIKDIYTGTALYFIWKKPYMIAANNTFIDFAMKHLGIQNLADDLTRYPQLSEAQLMAYRPKYIFLSSEPYPFRDKHIKEFQILFPNSNIILVDGEMFSWYGSRLELAADYFKEMNIDFV